ncbi:hypothetical protein [Acinetobacter wuhouensis]|uniref:Uncharacterized protein n=1 Tax=Acinetobacter wuhouensis TaxID=1879050 RepID=A0A4Q7AK10_9GAMM|nr:hypothetical protein [Acinetobacter wuhouensis]RZG47041.1 hypothetical protein EXU28_07590 [Acinetobacter wuhouensis]
MALTPLDTRVALMTQAPQIDFNQLTNNTLELYDNVKQRGQQGILSRLLAQNTGLDGQVDLNGAMLSAQANPKQAYQGTLVNALSGMLQQQKANALKAQQDAIKFDADTNKTYAETGKLTQEGLGKGLENSEKKFGAINQVFQAAALTGSKNNVLLGLNAANKAGLIDNEAFDQQRKIIDLMKPEEIKSYASGITLSGSKDPASYLYQTENNRADNAQLDKNSKRTLEGVKYDADKDFQLGQNKLAQDKIFNEQKIAWEKGQIKEIHTGSDGKSYIQYMDGKIEPNLLPNGQQFTVMPKQQAMNATTQKELFETTDATTAGTNAIANLKDALKYSAKAYDGVGATQRAYARGMIGDGSEEATATSMLDNITKGNALEQLKATFGGAPTEGERAILLQLQGAANMPRAQRDAIYTRAIQMAEIRLRANQEKANALRDGSYFKASQGGQAPQIDTSYMP